MEETKSKETGVSGVERLSRKEKEYLARRQGILDAALKLFSAKGYDGTNIQEIAQASEFSIGTIYNFFETKENLYLTIVEEKFREATERMEVEVSSEGDCIEKIKRVAGAVLAFMEENREFFNIFLGVRSIPEAAVHGGIRQKVRKYYQEYVRFFQAIMEEGIKAGLFRDFSSLELAYSLIGICNATIHEWLLGPGDTSLMARHEHILDLFFHGTLKRLSQKKNKR